jgi:hypothetical protein
LKVEKKIVLYQIVAKLFSEAVAKTCFDAAAVVGGVRHAEQG